VLARVDDLALLHYSGFLSHRPRCAQSLQALLQDFFGLPAQVRQFQGQWLALDEANCSRLGGANGQLAVNAVAGERVWDVASRFRLRLGPLRWDQFEAFLPDRTPAPARKALFILSQLVRLYVGPDLDFDVQLVLRARDVPECRLAADAVPGPYLGWNTWVRSAPLRRDADDAVFASQEAVRLGVYEGFSTPRDERSDSRGFRIPTPGIRCAHPGAWVHGSPGDRHGFRQPAGAGQQAEQHLPPRPGGGGRHVHVAH
jgi:type VI secretion system protein ImpH